MRDPEEMSLARQRSDRLMRWILTGGRVLGVVLIITGLGLYVATAPPLGGLHWHLEDVILSLALILGGWGLFTLSTNYKGE